MLLVEGVAYLDGGAASEYFKAIYRGDRFKLEMESRRSGSHESIGGPRMSVVLA